ncbi:unnamed protein product [Leuciscus chuanchicus]
MNLSSKEISRASTTAQWRSPALHSLAAEVLQCYLEERLRNVRKRLRAPHSQRQHSHPQPSQNSSSRPSFPLPESESSLTELHTMIEWLKNNRSPHSQVEELMIRTAPHRAAWIRSSA